MHSAFITTELRYPAVPLTRQLEHKRFVHPGPLVLRTGPLKSPAPTTDRDRTVSRRSEPSSRTALIGEQPNPWNLLQLQDAMSRHRGAKPERRYELLAPISLLSPAYLLSVERWPLHAREPGFKASHLSCAASAIVHSKGIVKVHGVFPSSCGQPASSPALQVRRVSRQDSRTFVTPFVQVGTYPTRNFATLGPL